MPEVTGLDMVEFLRRRPDTKDLPIVMLSSEAADTMVDRAMELGADTYVMKPVTIEELEKAMATAFYKHLKSVRRKWQVKNQRINTNQKKPTQQPDPRGSCRSYSSSFL